MDIALKVLIILVVLGLIVGLVAVLTSDLIPNVQLTGAGARDAIDTDFGNGTNTYAGPTQMVQAGLGVLFGDSLSYLFPLIGAAVLSVILLLVVIGLVRYLTSGA